MHDRTDRVLVTRVFPRFTLLPVFALTSFDFRGNFSFSFLWSSVFNTLILVLRHSFHMRSNNFIVFLDMYNLLWLKRHFRGLHDVPSQGSSVTNEETRGLAVFLCYLCANQKTLLPVLLQGVTHRSGRNASEITTVRKCISLFLLQP